MYIKLNPTHMVGVLPVSLHTQYYCVVAINLLLKYVESNSNKHEILLEPVFMIRIMCKLQKIGDDRRCL